MTTKIRQWQEQEQGQQQKKKQIPGGNDRKKSKSDGTAGTARAAANARSYYDADL
ncbi:MAG TPA: hypothetical protein VK814_02565 [Acidobacteriaceae bacterium]|jgi:hypothetical protein|nr:hypothetical protein [Acidobacteriaceae bacterium]